MAIDKITQIFSGKPKRCLSIDFGQGFVKFAYLEFVRQGVKLLCYDVKKVPSIDESNLKIAGFLNDFIKLNSIVEKEIYVSISSAEGIIVKSLIFPVVPKNEISPAIKWKLKGEIPFDIDEAVFGWQIVKEYTDDDGTKKNEIMCVLAKRQLIDKYIFCLKQCSVEIAAISVNSFNYSYILNRLPEKFNNCAVLDLGYSDAVLNVYKNNKLNFSRSLPFSCNKLTQSLTSALITNSGKVELSYEEAEGIKKTFGILTQESGMIKGEVTAFHVISLMRPFLESLSKELKRSFDYFSSHFKEEAVQVLCLTGGGADLKGLENYLKKELNINVLRLPLPVCIDVKAIDAIRFKNDECQIMGVLAVVFVPAGGINLLPQDVRFEKFEFAEKISLRLTGLVLAVSFLFSFSVVKFQMNDYARRLKTSRIHLEAIKEIKVLKQKVDEKEGLVKEIQKGRVPADGVLKLLSNIISTHIILNELSLDQQANSLILKGIIPVKAGSPETVLANFMEKLEASLFIKEAELVTSRKSETGQEFEIKCNLAR